MNGNTRRGIDLLVAGALLAAVCGALPADGADKPSGAEQQLSPLATRLTNYGKYEESSWSHLPTIGVMYVFLPVPPADQIEATQKRLAEHGLTVIVMRGNADLSTPNGYQGLAPQLATCQKMGVKYMFLSPKHPGATKEEACTRLRLAGDIARRYGVTLVLETHPDLGTNADVHLETMKRINHPNVRVNFDTGNIHFYNKDRNAPDELRKIIDYVATVEVKDHNGKYMDWTFPTLGKGVVDLRGVVQILKEHGFHGPVTMEVEGIHGVVLSEEQTKKNMAESAAYMRSIGAFR